MSINLRVKFNNKGNMQKYRTNKVNTRAYFTISIENGFATIKFFSLPLHCACHTCIAQKTKSAPGHSFRSYSGRVKEPIEKLFTYHCQSRAMFYLSITVSPTIGNNSEFTSFI